MSVKITCPRCKKVFRKWYEYAEHILEKHPEDEERGIWAKDALNARGEVEEPKVRGKPVDRVPPKRVK